MLVLTPSHMAITHAWTTLPTVGVLGCKVYGFLGTTGSLAEIWTLSVIAADRFQAISYPLQGNKRFTKKQAAFILAAIWSFALLFAAGPLFGWNAYVSEVSTYVLTKAVDKG